LHGNYVAPDGGFVWRALWHYIFEAKAPVTGELLAPAELASVVEQAHGCFAGLRALGVAGPGVQIGGEVCSRGFAKYPAHHDGFDAGGCGV
jgi:hypothetical protein